MSWWVCNDGGMKQAELEIRHRGIIDELNAKRKLSLTYYRDAYVEDDVRPLVEVLNNPWTVIADSLFDEKHLICFYDDETKEKIVCE